MGADTKANALGAARGTLELLEHAVLLDAACNDDGGRDPEVPVGEVDLFGQLCAPEFVNLKSVTIDTANGEVCRVSTGADKKANARESEEHRVGAERSHWGANTLRGRAAAHSSDSSTGLR